MTTPTGQRSGWQLIRSGPFSRLFWAGFISSTGDWAALFAQITLADAIGGTTGILVVLAARLLPGLVGGAIGGVLADRAGRKTAIILADVGRGGLVLLLAFVDNLGQLFAVSVVLEMLTLLGQPSRAASVPDLVGRENILVANSLTLGAAYGTFPIGAAMSWVLGLVPAITLSGLLPATTEAKVFLFNAVSFLLSGLIISFIQLEGDGGKARERPDTDRRDWKAPLRDIADGVAFVARDRRVRPIILGMSGALFGGGMLIVLGRAFAADVLRADEAGFFALLTALGTGAALGITVLSIYGDRLQHRDAVFGVSLSIAGIALMAAAVIKTVAGGMGWLTVMGLGAGAAYVTGFTHLHEQTEDELRGRTFAALFSLMRVGLLLAMAVAAPASELLDGVLPRPFQNATRDILFLGGVIILSAGAGTLWSIRSQLPPPEVTEEGIRPVVAIRRLRALWRRDEEES